MRARSTEAPRVHVAGALRGAGPPVGGNEAPTRGSDRRGSGGMPPSPLKEAFELIHFYLLFSEEGVEASTVRLSILEQIDIDPDFAVGEAVRTGLVEAHAEPVTTRKILRRGPRSAEMLRRVYGSLTGDARHAAWASRSAEMLRRVYGRDNPPTLEGIIAAERAARERGEAEFARLEALREAARPKEHNTAASLPAWVP